MRLRQVALCVSIALLSAFGWGQGLKLERVIFLPGVEGRIDHLGVDLAGNRVFLAALGNGTVEAVDVGRGQRVGAIKGLKEPQGLVYVPLNNTLYVATGGDGMVRSYDGRSLTPLKSIELGDDADNLRFNPQSNSIMVGYGTGALALLPLDLSSKAKTEVKLPAHPESFQLSADGGKVFVNVPRDQSIAAISLVPLAVTAKWGHLGALANFPMAADPGGDRLFVACRLPPRLLEVSTATGSVTQRVETVSDADDLFYDASHSRIYVIGGEGFVDIVNVQKDGKLNSIGHVPAAAGARTGLFVPAWNKLLVAAPHKGSSPARLLVFSVSAQ
jgi:DNA-binding beta-propeller fold protein YncE